MKQTKKMNQIQEFRISKDKKKQYLIKHKNFIAKCLNSISFKNSISF